MILPIYIDNTDLISSTNVMTMMQWLTMATWGWDVIYPACKTGTRQPPGLQSTAYHRYKPNKQNAKTSMKITHTHKSSTVVLHFWALMSLSGRPESSLWGFPNMAVLGRPSTSCPTELRRLLGDDMYTLQSRRGSETSGIHSSYGNLLMVDMMWTWCFEPMDFKVPYWHT